MTLARGGTGSERKIDKILFNSFRGVSEKGFALPAENTDNNRPRVSQPMKKTQGMNEKEFLALLQQVLPKTTHDPALASAIYDAVARQVQLRNHIASFEKFCSTGSLPDLEPQTVAEFKSQLSTNFGEANVLVEPAEEGKALAVEIALPDRTVASVVKVIPPGEEPVEETKAPLVPFPVALPEDPELIWVLARRENFSADEAARALAAIEEEFWATKAGLKLQKEVGEKTFADFIATVPAAALAASNLKRLYKAPETLRTLRLLPAAQQEETLDAS